VLGIASKYVSPISGLVGLISGFVVGMTRLFLQTSSDAGATYSGVLQAFVNVNWLYFAFLLFVFTCLVILTVSTFTPKADPAKLVGLTRDTVTPEQKAEVRASYGVWDIAHSIAILAIIAGVYIYFW
jgi:SSS family solute:Na+ symporter